MDFNEVSQPGQEVFDYAQKQPRPKLNKKDRAKLKEAMRKGRRAERLLQYIEGKRSKSQTMRSLGMKKEKEEKE